MFTPLINNVFHFFQGRSIKGDSGDRGPKGDKVKEILFFSNHEHFMKKCSALLMGQPHKTEFESSI